MCINILLSNLAVSKKYKEPHHKNFRKMYDMWKRGLFGEKKRGTACVDLALPIYEFEHFAESGIDA